MKKVKVFVRTLTIFSFLVVLIVVVVQAYAEHMKADIPFANFSQEQQQKIISKCMEFDAAGSLDILKNEEPDVWLMCMPLIINEKNK